MRIKSLVIAFAQLPVAPVMTDTLLPSLSPKSQVFYFSADPIVINICSIISPWDHSDSTSSTISICFFQRPCGSPGRCVWGCADVSFQQQLKTQCWLIGSCAKNRLISFFFCSSTLKPGVPPPLPPKVLLLIEFCGITWTVVLYVKAIAGDITRAVELLERINKHIINA